jgi:hypothetical protein
MNCDTEWLIGINCDTEWLIGINCDTGWLIGINLDTEWLIGINYDTEWLIGINVATGAVLCKRVILTIYCPLLSTYWVHKNVTQSVSLYRQLAINTEL